MTVADETDGPAINHWRPRPEGRPDSEALRGLCGKPFPVRMDTVLTIHQLTKQDKKLLVLCYTCFALLRRHMPNSRAMGMDLARHVLGLDA